MYEISADQRRRRLWSHHLLARPAAGDDALVQAADRLVGVHSTDPVSVFLALRARVVDVTPEDIEAALYEERSLVRMLGMRRTTFVLPVDLAPTVHGAVTAGLAAGERRRTLRLLSEGGATDDPERWFERVAAATMEALRGRCEATAVELTEDVPELGVQIEVGQGKKWGGKIGVSTRVLFWLATVGKIVRGQPLGSWKSTMYRWAPAENWLGFALDGEMDGAAARAELAASYLRAYGPATLDDLQWWTRWTKTKTRAALEAIDPVEVELDGASGWLLDEESVETVVGSEAADDSRVVLLPALDSTTMGWKARDWYLGDLAPQLFDRNGNAGPTVWHAGRIVGGWAQRPDGEVVVKMLVDAGEAVRAAAEADAARVADWLGGIRFVPRFRTPLERELSA
jgi:hypothetical protein